MHVDKYEQIWIRISIFVLVVFALAVLTATVSAGIQVPGVEGRVDPNLITTPGASPWAEPSVRELAPGKYEAYVLSQIWTFVPNEIRVPAGSEITFYVTSKDIIAASLEIGGRARGGKGWFGLIRKLPWDNPSFVAQNFAMILFAFGGISGVTNASYSMNLAVHNTTGFPATST